MADKTNISWTEATWNPIRGCSIVSPGCKNCYAMRVAFRYSGPGQPYEGLAEKVNGHPVWTGKIMLVEKVLDQPLRWARPRRIFVNSMSDLFHPDVPRDYLDRIFDVMERAPQHTFQVLTKRPERQREYMRQRVKGYVAEHYILSSRSPEQLYIKHQRHIWLGTSVEDQRRASERIPILLETPAAVRFLSCEPLIGEIDLSPFMHTMVTVSTDMREHGTSRQRIPGLHWVIAGGESGPGWRPMDPDWPRLLRDQCAQTGVAFFFKQAANFRPGTGELLDGRIHHDYPALQGEHPLVGQPALV